MTTIISYVGRSLKTFFSWTYNPVSQGDEMRELSRFGAAEWKSKLGVIISEPPVSQNLQKALEASCPFWPEKRVKETHLLCLIPNNLTIEDLQQLIDSANHPSNEPVTLDKPIEGYWILITQKVVPTTFSQPFTRQEAFLSKKGYRIPTALEAAIAVISAKYLGDIALYPERREATRCSDVSDQAIGSDPNIIFTIYGNNWDMDLGVAGVLSMP